jgi:ADP-ribosylglycohydrolase
VLSFVRARRAVEEAGTTRYRSESMESDSVPAPMAAYSETMFEEKKTQIGHYKDRAYGALLGAALGDAVCLQAAGLAPDPEGRQIEFPRSTAYRGHPPNDWTDVTDFGVLLMRTLGEYFTGDPDVPADVESMFASQIVQWIRAGFSELGDLGGARPFEGVVSRAAALPGFVTDPAAAAAAVVGPKAGNGALVRAVACAFTAAPAEWARLLGATTHADPRCAATAITFAHLLRDLGQSESFPRTLPIAAIWAGRAALTAPDQQKDFAQRLTRSKTVADLELGDRDNPSYTIKTLGVAIWAFRQLVRSREHGNAESGAALFKRVIADVAKQGGDSCANGAAAGAVLGAALGRAALPAEWLAGLPNLAWMDAEIGRFLEAALATLGPAEG